jgi:predicted dehydrogenase
VGRGAAAPLVREEETMNVQRILNAAYRSAEEGREVEVEA